MIIIIVAYDLNRLIGADNTLIWHIPEDLKRFKVLTMGGICIMGRNTWESLPEKVRPLPGRKNIVITHNPDYKVPNGVVLASSWEDAKTIAQDPEQMKEYHGKNIYVCGGAQIYTLSLPDADQVQVTEVAKIFSVENLRNPKYFPELPLDMVPTLLKSNQKTEGGLFYDYIQYDKLP
nr:Dihydrofolate reductase [uncultured bacterium]